jgi:6,7-dimethyl-8-ribityllumazine synthase
VTDLKTGYKAPAAPKAGEFSKARIVLVATRWNAEIVDALIVGAQRQLQSWGVSKNRIEEFRAPGAYELPLACEYAARSRRYDGLIALGAVIRGDTPHFEYVAGECARGLQQVALQQRVPIGFGVLTVDTVAQARERAGQGPDNKGAESAAAVLEMIRLKRSFRD